MNLKDIKYYYESELIKRIRQVTMLKNDKMYPYKNAVITLENLNPNILVPPQNYILDSVLKNVMDLAYSLDEYSVHNPGEYYDIFNLKYYDIFNLSGFLEFTLFDSFDKPIRRTLLPPIIEESIEADGTIKPIICDGMHRIYLARVRCLPSVNCVYIRGVSSRTPYYAYPVLGGWDGVKRISKLSPSLIKKFHRIRGNKKLYRNFDSVFTNSSAPRGSGN